MKKDDFYRFVGIINFFGVCPDFVYPIFEKDDELYFAQSENGIITSFKKIAEKLYIKMVRFIDIKSIELINVKEGYSIGDETVVAFQLDKNEFFISNVAGFIPFINEFDSDDVILKEEIDEFLDKVRIKKTLKKIIH